MTETFGSRINVSINSICSFSRGYELRRGIVKVWYFLKWLPTTSFGLFLCRYPCLLSPLWTKRRRFACGDSIHCLTVRRKRWMSSRLGWFTTSWWIARVALYSKTLSPKWLWSITMRLTFTDLWGCGRKARVSSWTCFQLVIVVFRASDGTINFIENISSATLADFLVCRDCKASFTYLTMYSVVRTQVINAPQYQLGTLRSDSPATEARPVSDPTDWSLSWRCFCHLCCRRHHVTSKSLWLWRLLEKPRPVQYHIEPLRSVLHNTPSSSDWWHLHIWDATDWKRTVGGIHYAASSLALM